MVDSANSQQETLMKDWITYLVALALGLTATAFAHSEEQTPQHAKVVLLTVAFDNETGEVVKFFVNGFPNVIACQGATSGLAALAQDQLPPSAHIGMSMCVGDSKVYHPGDDTTLPDVVGPGHNSDQKPETLTPGEDAPKAPAPPSVVPPTITNMSFMHVENDPNPPSTLPQKDQDAFTPIVIATIIQNHHPIKLLGVDKDGAMQSRDVSKMFDEAIQEMLKTAPPGHVIPIYVPDRCKEPAYLRPNGPGGQGST
jgi:hypothetical protein